VRSRLLDLPREIASLWENGGAWWTLEQVDNPRAPCEQWNALQMVWGMEAYRLVQARERGLAGPSGGRGEARQGGVGEYG
jgi:hypothetical protein